MLIQKEIVTVKKRHSNLPQNVTNIFTEEALLLPQIISSNVMKNPGGCKTLIGIMMGKLEFSFAPFGRDIKKESKFFTQNFRCI